jgi:class 3 adenylate cyclase/DNA-binding beta-propeller fold protein YncE
MRRGAPERRRLLTTVLFTDIVDSTKRATELGDARWRKLLSAHHTIVRRALKRHRGREIDTAGDGFFSTFDQPSDAIACAEEMIARLRDVGLEIRAGVHMGEVEAFGSTVSGIAVHIGARVMSRAAAGEVVVSSTVRDLMTGSDLSFDDLGFHQLKGVEAQLHLFSVRPTPHTALGSERRLSEPERHLGEPERERGSRVPLIAGGVLFGVIAVAAIAVVMLGGPEEETFAPAPNTVVRLDAASGDVVGGVHVGTTPTALAVGGDRLWVANFDDKTIQSVDLLTGTAGAAQGGVLANPTGLAVGGGFVWVTNGFAGQVVKFDPSEPNSVLPIEVGSGVQGIAFGFEHAWIAQPHEGVLLRLDPVTDEVERVDLVEGADPRDVTVGAGAVWVVDSLGGRVLAVDPSSLEVIQNVSLLEGHPSRIAFGEGFVWVTSTDSNSLTRIDPASGQSTTVEDVGNAPVGVAAGPGGVWVACSGDGTIAHVDPGSAEVVDRVRVGFSPDGVAVTPDGVWVSLHTR